MCGGPDRFCPAKSSTPILTWEGYYTTSAFIDECKPGTFRNLTNVVDDTLSPVQIPHVTKTVKPLAPCDLCPEGMYKAVEGDQKSLCLPCPHLTTRGNSTKDRTSCICYREGGGAPFEQLHFNVTTGTCVAVPLGFVSPDTHEAGSSHRTRTSQSECEPGHYCVGGIRYKCPAGRYGDKRRETSSLCSGTCEPGYYCEEGNFDPRQHACGSENLFCPRNSSAPTRVKKGWMTNENSGPEYRHFEVICPPGWYCKDGKRYKCKAGHFASNEGNSREECEGKCEVGHWCTEGSTSQTQNECGGSSLFCVKGSAQPAAVSPGFYTLAGMLDLHLRDKKDVQNRTMSAQHVCEPGYYCEGGIKYQCREGSWSNNWGMRSAGDCQPCEEGHWCTSYPGPPSTSAKQHECGSVDLYCPEGSHKPTNVSMGFYSIGGDSRNTTRVGQKKCEAGYYCSSGIKRACPAGVYGVRRGTRAPFYL